MSSRLKIISLFLARVKVKRLKLEIQLSFILLNCEGNPKVIFVSIWTIFRMIHEKIPSRQSEFENTRETFLSEAKESGSQTNPTQEAINQKEPWNYYHSLNQFELKFINNSIDAGLRQHNIGLCVSHRPQGGGDAQTDKHRLRRYIWVW